MIIIPIGIDCHPTFAIRDHNMRFFSWPFDWVVTYNGVADHFKEKFCNFLPKDSSLIWNDTYFIHNKFPDDAETMQRRIERFLDLLQTSDDEIIFFRKSHCPIHHDEIIKFNVKLKNDIMDAEELHDHIKATYPNLKFKIVLALICGQCFNCNDKYQTSKENLYIFNNSTMKQEEVESKFYEIFYKIFTPQKHHKVENTC